ncbi:uncharacterized protein LOC124913805 [Impatiens glandulifera]|uniref:uncharacterized protein LOC124913805 n=1 Tax=Impatiens glandulifera TaxID=253017 RepID=UPI001FB1A180|nr:uncharacterized protein LOC124913805 [Impatiens glandulifera]
MHFWGSITTTRSANSAIERKKGGGSKRKLPSPSYLDHLQIQFNSILILDVNSNMSWLARSIANSLRLEEEEEEEEDHTNNVTTNNPTYQDSDDLHHHLSDPSSPVIPERGVKEDLSELTKTLTRQFWGVASFLAPPPQSTEESGSSVDSDNPDASESVGIAGIRSDFAEIGGRFRSGISKLSNNINVSEITKIASNFLQLNVEGDDYDSTGIAVGVTREVVAFVRDISAHPQTWLDFPLPDDENHEFELSDVQQEHSLDVERLVPTLAGLKVELCPRHMSEGSFWKIYFVLLHPKLNEYEAELLSTPEIIKARASLMPNQKKADYYHEQESSSGSFSLENPINYVPEAAAAAEYESLPSTNNFETQKHMIQKDEIPIIDKSVVEENFETQKHMIQNNDDVDYDDDWLKEDSAEMVSTSKHEEEEDVSFSDLEEEEEEEGDADVTTSSYGKVTSGSDSSTKGSREWVELSRSSVSSNIDSVKVVAGGAKESNDWLDIDDEIDVE